MVIRAVLPTLFLLCWSAEVSADLVRGCAGAANVCYTARNITPKPCAPAARQGRRAFLLAGDAALPDQPQFASTLGVQGAPLRRGLKLSTTTARDDSFLAETACPASQVRPLCLSRLVSSERLKRCGQLFCPTPAACADCPLLVDTCYSLEEKCSTQFDIAAQRTALAIAAATRLLDRASACQSSFKCAPSAGAPAGARRARVHSLCAVLHGAQHRRVAGRLCAQRWQCGWLARHDDHGLAGASAHGVDVQANQQKVLQMTLNSKEWAGA